jgi:hypothetical protein
MFLVDEESRRYVDRRIPKLFGNYRNGSERYRNGSARYRERDRNSSGGIEMVSGTSESVPMNLGNVPGRN